MKEMTMCARGKLYKLLLSPSVMSAILFQIGWFVCIFCPPIIVLIYVVFYGVVHFLFICHQSLFWLFSLRLFFVGIAIDAFWVYSGIIQLAPVDKVIPYWLVCLWIMFALALPFGFGFIRKHNVLAVGLGLLGAPLSYIAGAAGRDDAMLMSPIWQSVLCIGVSWAVVLLLSNLMQHKMKLFTSNEQA